MTSNDKINNEWDSLNVLSNHASTVGSYDLGIFSSEDGRNLTLEKVKNNKCEVIFFWSDNLKFNKKMSLLFISEAMVIGVQKWLI